MLGNGLLVSVGILLHLCASVVHNSNLMWRWKCDSAACSRVSIDSQDANILYPSLETCRLVCGRFGGLWPQPINYTIISDTFFTFSLSSLKFIFPEDPEIETFLQGAAGLFTKSVSNDITLNCSNRNTITVSFNISSRLSDLTWDTDESYQLEVATDRSNGFVNISSKTIFGARHALETLSQLIEIYAYDNNENCYVIVDRVKISDVPAFPHRGLLLDSARNFLTLTSIKKHIDAMGYSKLNTLHWHITDSQSFPLLLPSLPKMTKFGAYSKDQVYTPHGIRELRAYAKQRGVRIIIEIDAPSHCGNGWQWGPHAGLGNLAVCVNQQPWRSYCIQPPCGQLNPANANLYTVLKDLYRDVHNMLPERVFHMGGDEVFIPCWNSTPEIINYLGNKSRTMETFLDFWSDYQAKALEAFDFAVGDSSTTIILWTSQLTNVDVIEKYLPKNRYVIQTWVPAADTLPQDLLRLGYRIIVSTKDAWYLDHGFWGNTLYHNWRTVYSNQIPNGTLGGEVCMWGEYVDDSSIEPRVWPRAAAAAERLWTNPVGSSRRAERRFYRHRERLVSRGIKTEALIPKWCYQNEGEC